MRVGSIYLATWDTLQEIDLHALETVVGGFGIPYLRQGGSYQPEPSLFLIDVPNLASVGAGLTYERGAGPDSDHFGYQLAAQLPTSLSLYQFAAFFTCVEHDGVPICE